MKFPTSKETQIMTRLRTIWLILLPLTLANFGLNTTPVKAETTYKLSSEYDIKNRFSLLTSPDVQPFYAQATPNWNNHHAPYGLTQLTGLVYGQINFDTDRFKFSDNPNFFGLQGLPIGGLVLGGDGPNRLFLTDIAIGDLDLQTQIVTNTGAFTITSGEGIFQGASGTLNFTETGPATPLDPSIPFTGRGLINGSILVSVPEPRTDREMLLGMSIFGASVMLRRSRHRSISDKQGVIPSVN